MAEQPWSVLVVCTGNLCRSPMAERLARAGFAERLGAEIADGVVQVSSAGTLAWVGSAMEPLAAKALEELGGDPVGFVARQLRAHVIDAADLVLCATRDHADVVGRMSPGAQDRTFTLREFARFAAAVSRAEGAVAEGPDLGGRPGPAGPAGTADPAGTAGAAGPAGTAGAADPAGTAGAADPAGTAGAADPAGTAVTGPAGAAGPAGPAEWAGANGSAGRARAERLVLAAASRRANLPPVGRADDEIPDPYGSDVESFRDCAALVAASLAGPLDLLADALRAR